MTKYTSDLEIQGGHLIINGVPSLTKKVTITKFEADRPNNFERNVQKPRLTEHGCMGAQTHWPMHETNCPSKVCTWKITKIMLFLYKSKDQKAAG